MGHYENSRRRSSRMQAPSPRRGEGWGEGVRMLEIRLHRPNPLTLARFARIADPSDRRSYHKNGVRRTPTLSPLGRGERALIAARILSNVASPLLLLDVVEAAQARNQRISADRQHEQH